MIDFTPIILWLLVISGAFLALLVALWASKRWMGLASLCWIMVAPTSLSMVADVAGEALPDGLLPGFEVRFLIGLVVMSITLALLWVRIRRCARIMWWLCMALIGAWVLHILWRLTGPFHSVGSMLTGPALAVALHALTAHAIRKMWPRQSHPKYERAFE